MIMSNNTELDILYQKYQKARDQADRAYDEMQSALSDRRKAREKMNNQFKRKEQNDAHYYTIWKAFRRIHNNNNGLIEALGHEALYANETRRKAIFDEITELSREIQEAKKEAKRRAPQTDKIAHRRAEYRYEQAKTRHEIAQTKYEQAERYCEQCRVDYERAKAAYEASTNQPPN